MSVVSILALRIVLVLAWTFVVSELCWYWGLPRRTEYLILIGGVLAGRLDATLEARAKKKSKE